MSKESKALIIVESPAKARTISKYLGDEYIVESSIGHIRDLPSTAKEIPEKLKKKSWARIGVDVENGFEPLYIVPQKKKAQVKRLKDQLKTASALYLATDEDREGEAIAWHLSEVLKPKVPVYRMVFHEITKTAITRALESPREIDRRLVEAQEARRILDRLYGYEVSPLLWKKIKPRLSAGRVQSVATRLIVERERERMKFVSGRYVSVAATLGAAMPPAIEANVVSFDGNRLALSKDFDAATGKCDPGVWVPSEAELPAVVGALQGSAVTVANIQQKPFTQRPSAPFITSTLQQEAGKRLRYTSNRTMRVAQRLYENGYITYMRTDSTSLSEQAVQAARAAIEASYGAAYLPDASRSYAKKVKGAQEAHEAIRPAGETFRSPESLAGELDGESLALYDMIWRRTLACQMKDAVGQRTQVQLTASFASALDTTAGKLESAQMNASGRIFTFDGFLKVMKQSNDAGGGEDKILPALEVGQTLDVKDIVGNEHQTKPPARFTEASLVKMLEEKGIGRPSTYASIIQTIQDRGYVWKKGTALLPTVTAFAVTQLLEEHFQALVDYEFTAQMESDLDDISGGDKDATPWLKRFYFGIDAANDDGKLGMGLKARLASGAEEIDPRAISSILLGHDDGGEVVAARVGRYGTYVQVGDTTQRASIPDEVVLDELNVDRAREMISKAALANRELGKSEDGKTIYLKSGKFGPYVQVGDIELDAKGNAKRGAAKPKMVSLWPTMDPETMTMDDAKRILAFPRSVGVHPEHGLDIMVQDGRYGPYVSMEGEDIKESRQLENHEQLESIDLAGALALLAQPARRGRRSATPAGPIAVLAESPITKKPIEVRTGRFGPYVTDGQVNATIPTTRSPETITFDDALELIARREAKMREDGKDPRAATEKKATRKKAPAKKKATKKKAAAKKTASKKSASKKTTE